MKNAVLSNGPVVLVNLPDGNDHPVVDIPFTAVIDGRQFRGRGLSLVAAYVSGLVDPAALNEARLVRLMFEFDGFSVSLIVEADLRDSASGAGDVELVFVRPTGPHLPQLRHILNAFIAGDLVGLGQTIGVAGTAAPKGRKVAGTAERGLSLRRVAGGAGIALASLALIAVAAPLVYQRLFVSLVPTLGTVVSTAEVLRATTTGQLVFLDLTAGEGDVAVAIQSASGEVQSLVMPCDCAPSTYGQREGSTVLMGEPVLQLASAGDRRLVAADIPPAMLFDLAAADRIELTFPDGASTLATTEWSGLPDPRAEAQTIHLTPDVPLDPSRVGQPVEVRILRDAGRLGALFGDAGDDLRTSAAATNARLGAWAETSGTRLETWIVATRERLATFADAAGDRLATLFKGA